MYKNNIFEGLTQYYCCKISLKKEVTFFAVKFLCQAIISEKVLSLNFIILSV